MRPQRSPWPAVAVVVGVLLVVAGCGVPQTDGPQPLPTDLVELLSQPSDEAPAAAARPTDLAWVKGRRFVLASRAVTAYDAASQGEAALAAVIAGPTPAEAARGLGTEVPPDLQAAVSLDGVNATIDIAGTGTAGAGDATLATGQLALAVLLVPGIDTVRFTVSGAPAEVPRIDGTFRRSRLTLADYASLLGPAARRAAAATASAAGSSPGS